MRGLQRHASSPRLRNGAAHGRRSRGNSPVAAKAELQQASLTSALWGLRAADPMSSPVETAHGWTVRRFIDGPAIEARHSALPLLDFDGSPSGLLRLPQLTRIPVLQRETLRLTRLRPPGSPPSLVLDGRREGRHGSAAPAQVTEAAGRHTGNGSRIGSGPCATRWTVG